MNDAAPVRSTRFIERSDARDIHAATTKGPAPHQTPHHHTHHIKSISDRTQHRRKIARAIARSSQIAGEEQERTRTYHTTSACRTGRLSCWTWRQPLWMCRAFELLFGAMSSRQRFRSQQPLTNRETQLLSETELVPEKQSDHLRASAKRERSLLVRQRVRR